MHFFFNFLVLDFLFLLSTQHAVKKINSFGLKLFLSNSNFNLLLVTPNVNEYLYLNYNPFLSTLVIVFPKLVIFVPELNF